MIWKYSIVVVCAVVVGLVTGLSVGAQETPEQGAPSTLKVNQIMRVGDRIVTAEQLIARVWDFESSIPQNERVLEPALAYLRDVTLLELEADRLGLTLTQEEIEKVTSAQLNRIREEIRRSTRGAVPYEEWLQRQGLDKTSFERYVRDRARVILLKYVMVNWFEKHHDFIEAAHIVVHTRDRANDLHQRLRETAPDRLLERFEELAVQHGVDPAAGVTKGRLPRLYVNDGSVVDAVHNTAWALEDMKFSEPVRAKYTGDRTFYHIVLRIRTYNQPNKPLTEVRDELIESYDVQVGYDEDTSFEERYNRFVRWAFNTQGYEVERRLPGFDTDPDVE
jgi:hypothetical protein